MTVLPKFSKFEDFLDGQMFICSTATEQECLDSCLFGSPRNMWPEVRQITKNTAIFLYTIGEQPTLHGVFIAVGQPFLDMDKSAFGGRFPSQVRVKRFYRFPAIPGGKVTKTFRGDRNRQRRLTRRETHEILASAISYMYNQNHAGILERLTKQRKEAPAQLTAPIMRSGTPIYIYNPKNTRVAFTKPTFPLPSNAKDGGLPPLPALAFQRITLGEYKPPPLFPMATTSIKYAVESRVEQRKVVRGGFSITQAGSLPQYLYFPVLRQATQAHLKTLPPRNSTALVTKLYAGNLHKSITKDNLRDSFAYFGKVLNSGIKKNAAGHSMGSGWVEFENPTEAATAIERVNGMQIAGLSVVVCPWSD